MLGRNASISISQCRVPVLDELGWSEIVWSRELTAVIGKPIGVEDPVVCKSKTTFAIKTRVGLCLRPKSFIQPRNSN